jgi:hypothetical protein
MEISWLDFFRRNTALLLPLEVFLKSHSTFGFVSAFLPRSWLMDWKISGKS